MNNQDQLQLVTKNVNKELPINTIIIPFAYCENKKFESIINRLEDGIILKDGAIQKWKPKSIASYDNELYSHISSLVFPSQGLCVEENIRSNACIGKSFEYEKEVSKIPHFSQWIEVYSKNESIGAYTIESAKLVLFKTGIGFLLLDVKYSKQTRFVEEIAKLNNAIKSVKNKKYSFYFEKEIDIYFDENELSVKEPSEVNKSIKVIYNKQEYYLKIDDTLANYVKYTNEEYIVHKIIKKGESNFILKYKTSYKFEKVLDNLLKGIKVKTFFNDVYSTADLDICDVEIEFLKELKKTNKSKVSKYIYDKLPLQVQTNISINNYAMEKSFIKALNDIIEQEDFYNTSIFTDVNKKNNTKLNESIKTRKNTKKMNRLLIEEYYPNLINRETRFYPKKTHLFSSVLVEKGKWAIKDFDTGFYHLRKGYTESYLPSEKEFNTENNSEILKSFENSYWGISREGCSNLCHLTGCDGPDAFFRGNYADRINNYLYIYILILHQYYGLLNLSKEVSELSSNTKYYVKSKKEYNKLKKIRDNISFFYLKCVYEEISHITHQAKLYNMMIEELGIKRMQDELHYEMEKVVEIIEQVREDKKNKDLRVIVFIGVLFTIVQTLESSLSIGENILLPTDIIEKYKWIFKQLPIILDDSKISEIIIAFNIMWHIIIFGMVIGLLWRVCVFWYDRRE